MLARSFVFGEMIKSVAKSASQVLHLSDWKAVSSSVPPDGNFRKILIISRCLCFFFFFLSSTSLLLPTHLPPPSYMQAQSCNPMDRSLPGSSVHELFQARILEWVAISFSNIQRTYENTPTEKGSARLPLFPTVLPLNQSVSYRATKENGGVSKESRCWLHLPFKGRL